MKNERQGIQDRHLSFQANLIRSELFSNFSLEDQVAIMLIANNAFYEANKDDYEEYDRSNGNLAALEQETL
jgi:hypothetical protein